SSRGVFIAAYEEMDNAELEAYEWTELQRILEWFREHLHVPGCVGTPENDRAICWFRAETGRAVKRIWALVSFLEARGIPVTMHRTADPGTIIYRDANQVVAFPRRRRKRERRTSKRPMLAR